MTADQLVRAAIDDWAITAESAVVVISIDPTISGPVRLFLTKIARDRTLPHDVPLSYTTTDTARIRPSTPIPPGISPRTGSSSMTDVKGRRNKAIRPSLNRPCQEIL